MRFHDFQKGGGQKDFEQNSLYVHVKALFNPIQHRAGKNALEHIIGLTAKKPT